MTEEQAKTRVDDRQLNNVHQWQKAPLEYAYGSASTACSN